MSDKAERKGFFPLAGSNNDGWSTDREATATCYCGAVQYKFPLDKVVTSFVCNCADCHKFTASIFASNFVVADPDVTFTRGESNLTHYGQSNTIQRGFTMTNSFCKTCGTLLWRKGVGFPGMTIARIGTVDDFSLHDTVLKPDFEQFGKHRPSWLSGAVGVQQFHGNHSAGEP